jgi:Ca2+-binding EF-hand superfamily protein
VCTQNAEAVFAQVDADASGTLDESEVFTVCKMLGKKVRRHLLALARHRRDGASRTEMGWQRASD